MKWFYFFINLTES